MPDISARGESYEKTLGVMMCELFLSYPEIMVVAEVNPTTRHTHTPPF